MKRWWLSVIALGFLVIAGCGPSGESERATVAVPMSKEDLTRRGSDLAAQRLWDSAAVLLGRAVSLDSTYLPSMVALGSLHYDRAMMEAGEGGTARKSHLRKAKLYLARVEAQDAADAEIYERLCQIAVALDDQRAFVKYAKKNAEKYPYDRQWYNLGLAYFESGEYQRVIATQKEAAEKFPHSLYVGGYYRQMGRAYTKLDRDQTAERIFDKGIKTVDMRLAELRKEGGTAASGEGYRRLLDDRIGMLLGLKKLHQTYKAFDKLEKVERELRESGYSRDR